MVYSKRNSVIIKGRRQWGRLVSVFLAVLLMIHSISYAQTTRGFRAKDYKKTINNIVDKLEKQLDKKEKYTITVAGFHPTTGPNLNLSNIIEAALVNELSSRSIFDVTFYKDNAEALKIIQATQSAFFDKAIELGKFVSADYLATGDYTIRDSKIDLRIMVQDLKKNIRIAGEDGTIKAKSLPENALKPIPEKPVPLEKSIEQLISDIEVPMTAQPKIVVGNFTYGDSTIPSEFGAFIKDKVQNSLVQSRRYVIVTGKALEDLNSKDKMGEDTTMRGMQNAVNLIITGRYWDMGDKIGIALVMKGDDEQIHHSSEVNISKNSLPRGLSIKPTDFDAMKNEIKETESMNQSSTAQDSSSTQSDKSFQVKVWPSKGDGAVYKEGEKVSFYFKANQDCYLILFHRDKDGTEQWLFPNTFARNNFIKKDTVYLIPDESYNFEITASEPFGHEMVKAIASTQQFSEVKQVDWNTVDAFKPGSTRGLSISSKAAIEATDTCTLLTIKK